MHCREQSRRQRMFSRVREAISDRHHLRATREVNRLTRAKNKFHSQEDYLSQVTCDAECEQEKPNCLGWFDRLVTDFGLVCFEDHRGSFPAGQTWKFRCCLFETL